MSSRLSTLTTSRYASPRARSSIYGSRLPASPYRPVPVVQQPTPVPALVVQTPRVRVAVTESALDRVLRAVGEVIRDVAPLALGAFVVHRVCLAVENSSRR